VASQPRAAAQPARVHAPPPIAHSAPQAHACHPHANEKLDGAGSSGGAAAVSLLACERIERSAARAACLACAETRKASGTQSATRRSGAWLRPTEQRSRTSSSDGATACKRDEGCALGRLELSAGYRSRARRRTSSGSKTPR